MKLFLKIGFVSLLLGAGFAFFFQRDKTIYNFQKVSFQNDTYEYGIRYLESQSSYVLTGIIKQVDFKLDSVILTIATQDSQTKFPWLGRRIVLNNPHLILIRDSVDQSSYQWRGDYDQNIQKKEYSKGQIVSLFFDSYQSPKISDIKRVIIHSYLKNTNK